MNEFQFYVYSLIMRITNVIHSDLEDLDDDDLLDLLIEILFLLLIVCSILGAFLCILTTGFIPFQTASVTIFILLCMIIWFTTL